MKVVVKDINKIQPSQLYLCEEKLVEAEVYIESVSFDKVEPLPVKTIGKHTFFTDGHTRAYALYKKGIEKIKVYEDKDALNWLEYLICLEWCKAEGILQIADLREKIIPERDYQKYWLNRCRNMQQKVEANPDDFIEIKPLTNCTSKSEITDVILRRLPEWFGIEEAIQEYVEGVKKTTFLTAKIKSTEIGFISLKEHNNYTGEIYVMGILKEFHRRGIGKKLTDYAAMILKNENKKFMTVKTLSSSHPDKNYQKTRKFYRAMGFFPLEEFKELWGEESPCLFMVKKL